MTPLLSSAVLRAQSDERLVALAAAGHDRAFEAIVERYRRPLLRYLRRLLSATLAEDVVQATFINAWSSLRTGTEVRDLRPWLYRIAHNAAVNALKKVGEALEEVPESAGGFATEPATQLERRDEMLHALTSIAALPSRQRAALLAVAIDGRAHAEVAEELGLTDGAVRQLVHRARTTLRAAATALTPIPLLHAVVASAGDSTVARIAEVAAGAGGAGAASVSLKAGAAAVVATGALVTGGPEVAKVVHPSQKPAEPASEGPPPPSQDSGPGGGGASAPPAFAPAADRPASSASSGRSGSAAGESRRGRRGGGGGNNSGPSENSGRRRRAAGEDRRGRRSGGGGDARSGSNRGSGSSGRSGGHGARSSSSGPGSSGSGSGGSGSGGSGSGDAFGDGGGSSGSGGGGGDSDDDLVVTAPVPTAPSGGSGGSGGQGDSSQAETRAQSVPAVPTAPSEGDGGSGGSGSGGGSGSSGGGD